MTEKEQIEDIAAVIPDTYNDFWKDTKIINERFKEAIATALYDAGYRKVLLDTENGKMINCVQYAPWQLIEGYTEREVKKACKETAKKILTDIDNDLHDLGVEYANSKHMDYFAVCEYIHHKVIRKIADKQGVNIEE